jgi:hypothetical protein
VLAVDLLDETEDEWARWINGLESEVFGEDMVDVNWQSQWMWKGYVTDVSRANLGSI